MKPGNLSIAPHIRPTTLSRTVRLLEDHGQRVMYKVSPLSLVLGAKLSLEGNGSGPDSVSSMAYRNRTKSRRNSDGLGIACLQFKFVVDCGVLFCYSNATITPKGAKRGSLGGVDKEPILLDTFPLSVCHVTVDPAPAPTQTWADRPRNHRQNSAEELCSTGYSTQHSTEYSTEHSTT